MAAFPLCLAEPQRPPLPRWLWAPGQVPEGAVHSNVQVRTTGHPWGVGISELSVLSLQQSVYYI